MTSKNEIKTLGELSVDNKGSYGIAASAVEYSEDLYTYLRISDITDDGRINKNDLKSVNERNAEDYLLKPNDIVFARTGGSTGRNYFYDGNDGQFVYAGFLIKFSIDPQKVNPKYIKYYCQSKNYRDWVHSFNTGSTRGNINAQTYSKMPILLPPRTQQNVLVKVLSSLDDKIELNNKINQNLEQQAQAIFNTYISKYSSTKYKVKDVILTANTGADAIQKAPIVDYDTGIRCVRVGDLSNNRNFWQWGFTKVTNDVFEQYQLKKDDIIVTRTATLGLNRLITENLSAVYNNGLIRITVDNNKIFPLLLYRHFQTKDFFNYISRIESETSVRPNMKINYLLDYEFSYLKLTEQNELVKILTVLSQIVEINNVENEKLTQLRDTLLPKLMSGEIDVDKVGV